MGRGTETLILRASVLSIVAGLLHGAVTPNHFAEWWGYGLFFLLASFAQVTYGAVPLFARLVEGEPIERQWSRRKVATYAWLGIAGNAAVIALYVVTRTVGIPLFGPEAGVVEEVRALDVASKLVEAALIVVLALVLRIPSGKADLARRPA